MTHLPCQFSWSSRLVVRMHGRTIDHSQWLDPGVFWLYRNAINEEDTIHALLFLRTTNKPSSLVPYLSESYLFIWDTYPTVAIDSLIFQCIRSHFHWRWPLAKLFVIDVRPYETSCRERASCLESREWHKNKVPKIMEQTWMKPIANGEICPCPMPPWKIHVSLWAPLYMLHLL